MPTYSIYLYIINPSALYLNAIKLSVCQYQLKDIFVCSIVPCLLVISADTVPYEQVEGENGLAGMACSVLTATLELIDMTCQHPECPQRAMTVAFTRMSFCKSLTGQIYKNCPLPGKLVVHQCSKSLCASFGNY